MPALELPPVLTRRGAASPEAVLGELAVTGVFHATSRLAEPWGIAMPPLPQVVVFHLLTSGSAVVQVDGATTPLAPGGLCVVPRGTGHDILSSPGVRATPLAHVPREVVGERYERLELDGGGAPAGLVCGAVRFSDPAVGRLVASLPPVLVLPADDAWVRDTMHVIAQESEQPSPGSDAVTARLAEVLLVRAVRSWWRAQAPSAGWLAAVRDPLLGPALSAFHAAPQEAWSLERLAAVARLSRSAFAARFTAVAGEPAMTYVARWRMDVAARLLQDPSLPVATVARRVGYTAAPAFTRAFRRHHGRPPTGWRADPADVLGDALGALT